MFCPRSIGVFLIIFFFFLCTSTVRLVTKSDTEDDIKRVHWPDMVRIYEDQLFLFDDPGVLGLEAASRAGPPPGDGRGQLPPKQNRFFSQLIGDGRGQLPPQQTGSSASWLEKGRGQLPPKETGPLVSWLKMAEVRFRLNKTGSLVSWLEMAAVS